MKGVVAIYSLFALCSASQLNASADEFPKSKFIVHFDFNSYELNAQTKTELDSLLHFLQAENLSVSEIEIAGHCDSVGSGDYNDVLSLKRARAVSSYLVSKGIGASLISSVKGFGKRNLVGDDQSDNRRVEIDIRLKTAAKAAIEVDTVKVNQAKHLPDSSGLQTIDLSSVQVNDVIPLADINFYPDRHLIVESSMKNLKILRNTMLVNKTLRIEIRGHVCCTPGYQGDAMDIDTYTEDLSLQRAKEIYLYLSENGVGRDRMTYVGLGGKYPLVKEFTEQDKATNRRVEIKILSK